MKKIVSNALMSIVYQIDCWLYRKFNYVSPTRKEIHRKRAERLQRQLDSEHQNAEYLNKVYSTYYTTKQALELAKLNEL